MASSFFKLKILKKTLLSSNKITTGVLEHNLEVNNLSLPVTTNKCRVCLEKGSLPIYGSKTMADISASLELFGGIKISQTDSFPKHLCDICYSLLQNAILFRKKAVTSDLALHTGFSMHSTTDSNLDNITSDNDETQDFDIKLYSCKVCKQSFHSRDEYIQHKNSKQHRNVRVQCPICYGLLTAQLFKKHLIRHRTTSHLICHVCGKMYRKDNLVRHLQLHSYSLPYQCKLCPYRGRFIDSLKIHMRTHTGNKPFSCDKCKLCFLTRSNLSRHLLTHKKEKPFKCMECGKCFYVKHDMDLHCKVDHEGIKDFGCKTCGNKYGTRKTLMRHELKVHEREKMARGRLPLYMQEKYKI